MDEEDDDNVTQVPTSLKAEVKKERNILNKILCFICCCDSSGFSRSSPYSKEYEMTDE